MLIVMLKLEKVQAGEALKSASWGGFAAVCNPLPCFSQAPPAERPAPLRAQGEAAEAEGQWQSKKLLEVPAVVSKSRARDVRFRLSPVPTPLALWLQEQAAAERRKIVWEWRELRGFLEEQEQRLLSWLEELERAIVSRDGTVLARRPRVPPRPLPAAQPLPQPSSLTPGCVGAAVAPGSADSATTSARSQNPQNQSVPQKAPKPVSVPFP
nr:uncharacterized protein LOC116836060 [Chelonoidis abingdonii]